jgi:hypothetical protein
MMHRLGTGTWDQICGITSTGEVYCAGFNIGVTPVAKGTHQNFYVDTFGTLNTDSTTVLRVPNSRAECQVKTTGYQCGNLSYGQAGKVVDGTVQGASPTNGTSCFLDTAGTVTCNPWSPGPQPTPTNMPAFTAMPVLAIAGNFYSDDLCAVYNDGSIACKGSNKHGELGTGNTQAVNSETIVAPAGTIDVTCK